MCRPLYRLRDPTAIQGLAIYGILVGFTIVGLYSWSVSRYQSAVAHCQSISVSNVNLCNVSTFDLSLPIHSMISRTRFFFFIGNRLHIQVVGWPSILCSSFAELRPLD